MSKSDWEEVWGIKEGLAAWSGALAAAGDVVFYGTMEGWLKAVHARTGEVLWKFKTPWNYRHRRSARVSAPGHGRASRNLTVQRGFQFRDLRSLTSENWNGFTVGVQGTADEVFPPGVPEPTSLVLPGTGLIGLIWRRRQSKQ